MSLPLGRWAIAEGYVPGWSAGCWGAERDYGYPGDGINRLLGAFHEEREGVREG